MELVPPLWFWFPITLLLAPMLVAAHVHAVSGNHDRSDRDRIVLAGLAALVVVAALGASGATGRGVCVDNEWSAVGPRSTSDAGPLVLLVVWFSLVTAVYAAAGLRASAVVAPVAITLAMLPGLALEAGISYSSLSTYCAGDGQRALVAHLSIAALVPLGAAVVGLIRPRWH